MIHPAFVYVPTGGMAGQMCRGCGALVGDPDQHMKWHDGLVDLLTRIASGEALSDERQL